MRFTYDQDACAEFAAKVLGQNKCWGAWFQCFGLERDGKMVAAVVFNDYTGENVELTFASDGRWAFRSFIHRAFQYAFGELGCKRITAHIRPSNDKALTTARRLGFKDEGLARRWFGDEDAVILGLLPDEVLI